MKVVTQPILTVITVVRNAGEMIRGCIESVCAQAIEELEYIVIDGASTDNTLAIVESYGDAVTKIISEPDDGLYDAMNKGLRLAQGRYIHFLNADDRYAAPDVLKQFLPQLKEDKFCYGTLLYRDETGHTRTLGQEFSWRDELRASRVPQPTLFVPKKLYDEVGLFDLRYRIAADYDMVLRLAQRFPAKYISIPVTLMQAGGISYRQMKRGFYEAACISQRHGRTFLGSRATYLYRTLKWELARRLPPVFLQQLRHLRGRS